MTRCRMWRYVGGSLRDADGHVSHDPGGRCRRCWVPCRTKVARGHGPCDACVSAIAAHPRDDVRMALIAERTVSDAALSLLTGDSSLRVSARAHAALQERGVDHG